ncbi:hypothetical protein [Methanopyrus sp.]
MEVREASPDPRMRVSVRPKAGTWSETARFDMRWNFQRVTDELYVYVISEGSVHDSPRSRRVDCEVLYSTYCLGKGIMDRFGHVEMSSGSHDVGVYLYLVGEEVRRFGSVVRTVIE